MPQQIFQVLRCYKCQVFQVHQCKKSIKWECKMCGEKQSIKRHYGIGTAKDCRGHVQRLNGIRGELDETENAEDIDDSDDDEVSHVNIVNNSSAKVKESKWKNYVEENKAETSILPKPNETMYLDDTEVVLERPKKRRLQKRNNSYKRKYSKSKTYNNDSEDEIDIDPEDPEVKTQTKVKFVPPTIKSNLNRESVSNASNPKETLHDDEIDDCFNNSTKLEINRLKTETITMSNKQKKNIPTLAKPNSKWANYIDDVEKHAEDPFLHDDDSEEKEILTSACVDYNSNDDYDSGDGAQNTKSISANENYYLQTNFETNEPSLTKEVNKESLQQIFSLCDDNELDDVLNF